MPIAGVDAAPFPPMRTRVREFSRVRGARREQDDVVAASLLLERT
jgi:hypothetical protein